MQQQLFRAKFQEANFLVSSQECMRMAKGDSVNNRENLKDHNIKATTDETGKLLPQSDVFRFPFALGETKLFGYGFKQIKT